MVNKQDLENNLNRIHEWTRAADQKVGIFLAFQGIITMIVVTDLFDRLKIKLEVDVYFVGFVILIILFLLTYSIIKSFLALNARINLNKSKKSFTYFRDISDRNLADYRNFMSKVSDEHYRHELIEQIYYSSKVASYKFIHFREAMAVFFIAFFCVILGYLMTII